MKRDAILKLVGETKNFYIFEDRKSIICNKVYVEKESFTEKPAAALFEITAIDTVAAKVESIG